MVAVDRSKVEAAELVDEAEAHFKYAFASAKEGKYQEAIDSYRRVLSLRPDSAGVYNNLGNVFMRQGKVADAVASYGQAVRLKPDHADAHSNLGNALRVQGRLHEAVVSLLESLRLQPINAGAHNNLGIVLHEQGKLAEAESSLRRALRLDPNFADAYLNLGNLFKDQARLDDAIEEYRVSMRLDPKASHLHSNLLLAMHYYPGVGPDVLMAEYRRWNQLHAEPLATLIQPHTNSADPQRRLRIGYVSPGFRNHVDSYFTIPLLSNHDHQHYEIYCYADVSQPDALTERLQGYADVWRPTAGLSDQQLADTIRKDGIDILVDLAMHTAGNRLLVFARKPAPVQVTWLGYPGTTGLSTIDYRVTDPYLDPEGLFDFFYSEKSIRLPNTFWCYDPLTNEPAVNALPALRNGYVTFGCLNTFCKINDGCLVLWAQVLRATPSSHLLLRAPTGSARDHVLAVLEREGVTASRVEFVDKVTRPHYLQLYHRIDVGLDPGPYNGHTTSLDSFWMGVPVLTLVGHTVVGRAGWSQLCNLGLQELAAESAERFVEFAAQLAGDLPQLQALRGSLRQRMQRSPLMNANRFARDMEQAFREMWQRWCRQAEPTAFHELATSSRLTTELEGSPVRSIAELLESAWTKFRAGRLHEAEQVCLEILRKAPEQTAALHFLGLIASQTGRDDLALTYLGATVRLKPDFAEAHCNLGNVFINQKNLPGAVACYEAAVRLRPDYALAYNNLGNAQRQQGLPSEAEVSFRQALQIKPDYAEAHNNLGSLLQAQGKLTEAEVELNTALSLGLDVDQADFHMNLGNIFRELGRLEESIAAYRTALELNPNNAHIHSNLLAVLHYHPAYDAERIYAECRRWNEVHAVPLAKFILPHTNLAVSDRRLRIGYISPGFHNHVDSLFTIPLLSNHDHSQYEIFCYSDVTRPDEFTERLRGYADVWRHTAGVAAEQVAETIRNDRVDILVDLSLHTASNRLLVFARKPAPVQVNWLGYPGTTGLSTIDYRLTDPHLDPPGMFDAFYSEESIHLLETFWCYDPCTDKPSVNALPALENGFITFGCLNTFCKINDGVLRLWGQVLRACLSRASCCGRREARHESEC